MHLVFFVSTWYWFSYHHKNVGCVFAGLSRQYLELLSMLNGREQRAYQGTKPPYSPERDASVLEVRGHKSTFHRERKRVKSRIRTKALHSDQLPHTLCIVQTTKHIFLVIARVSPEAHYHISLPCHTMDLEVSGPLFVWDHDNTALCNCLGCLRKLCWYYCKASLS